MQIRALLFDLDGTLVNSLPGIEFSIDCSLAECELPKRSRDVRTLIGPPIREIFAQLLPETTEEQLSRLERAFRRSYDSVGWRKTVLYDDAREVLARLHEAGVSLFLVTNKPAGATEQILRDLQLFDLFEDIACRDSRTPRFASKAEMLREILERHRLDTATCLYIGDTAEDYRAAAESGTPVALVAHGYGEAASRSVLPDCLHLNSLSELLNLIEVMEMS